MKPPEHLPFVSIIIPCRNEAHFIEKCLESVLKNNYPKTRLEILVVDGLSEDETKSIVKKLAITYPFIQIIDNPKKITPCALNIGIRRSRGDIIMRMDAHSIYKHNYISSCVKYSKEYNADNVGGIFAATPFTQTLIAKSIAFAMSHPFGVGNSHFRIYPKKVQEADTVAFGCYKRAVFKKIGMFNENLARSQDMEFNIRLKKAGGKIILFPNIIAYYYTDATLAKFINHNFKDGIWAIYPTKFIKGLLRPRHLAPFLFISTLLVLALLSLLHSAFSSLLLGILGLYGLCAFLSSLHIALRKRDGRYLVTMPIVFAARHFTYGIGSLLGFIKLTVPPWNRQRQH